MYEKRHNPRHKNERAAPVQAKQIVSVSDTRRRAQVIEGKHAITEPEGAIMKNPGFEFPSLASAHPFSAGRSLVDSEAHDLISDTTKKCKKQRSPAHKAW